MTEARWCAWLRRRAENVVALLLAVMFVVFLIQIVSRYLLNLPIGWTQEVSVILWIWLVLFGAAFVTRDAEQLRFDLLYGAVGPRVRRGLVAVTSVILAGLLALALPATVDYVAFMKVESTAYLHIRFDWLFSIYVVFAVAMIARHLWMGWQALRGTGAAGPGDPSQKSSGV